MPLYLCTAKTKAVPPQAKQKIAGDITRIHCAVTDAPPEFVHAFFLEEGPDRPLGDKKLSVLASIRAGRTQDQKASIQQQLEDSIQHHTGLCGEDVAIQLVDTPARWVMEGGEIFPEPGEEAAWMEKQAGILQPNA